MPNLANQYGQWEQKNNKWYPKGQWYPETQTVGGGGMNLGGGGGMNLGGGGGGINLGRQQIQDLQKIALLSELGFSDRQLMPMIGETLFAEPEDLRQKMIDEMTYLTSMGEGITALEEMGMGGLTQPYRGTLARQYGLDLPLTATAGQETRGLGDLAAQIRAKRMEELVQDPAALLKSPREMAEYEYLQAGGDPTLENLQYDPYTGQYGQFKRVGLADLFTGQSSRALERYKEKLKPRWWQYVPTPAMPLGTLIRGLTPEYEPM